MTPASHLFADTLSLTPPRISDAAVFSRLLADPMVRRYLGGPVPAADHKRRFDAYMSAQPDIGIWMIRLAETADPLGLITLTPHHDGVDLEVSFELLPEVWGMGHAKQAVGAVITHALDDLGLPRVVAETQVANVACRRLLDRLDMVEIDRIVRFDAPQVIYATR